MTLKWVLTSFLTIYYCNGAKILGIIPAPSYSHNQAFKPLWKELSLRGHQVTTMTSFPINNPELKNLTEIDLSATHRLWDHHISEIAQDRESFTFYITIYDLYFRIVEQQLRHSNVQTLIHDNETIFDLVIVEYYSTAMIAFSEKFRCPVIGIVAGDLPNYKYGSIGNPNHPMAYPDVNLPNWRVSSIAARVMNTVYWIMLETISVLYINRRENELIKKYFGNNYPPAEELEKSVSLVFVNTNSALNKFRPLTPSIIPIGGCLHCVPPKPLPKVLKKILDNSSNGFIYFSLGSNIKSTDLNSKVINTMLNSFSELPYIVLWKYYSDDFPNKPENVMISKWWPQQDLLGHSKIKLFITQGGLQSIEEAIYAQIPLVGIPFYGDQPGNVKNFVNKGFGLSVDLDNINKENFKQIILEVINNPKYKSKVREVSILAKDQPMTGLERAVWWTEYVLRHKGASHLRNPLMDIPWYQYYLLDVVGLMVLCLSTAIYVFYSLLHVLLKTCNYGLRLKSKAKSKSD